MHAQIIVNILDFGMNLQEAGDAPRILHSGSSSPTDALMTDGGFVSLESGFSETVQRELMDQRVPLGGDAAPMRRQLRLGVGALRADRLIQALAYALQLLPTAVADAVATLEAHGEAQVHEFQQVQVAAWEGQ